MKYITGIILLLAITSCSDKFECHDDIFEYTVQNGKVDIEMMDTLGFSYFITISDGDELIFDINQIGAQCDLIQDDETGQRITFSIDAEIEELELIDQELASINAIHQEYGAWVRRGTLIDEGFIIIKKMGENSWEIQGELEIEAIQFEDSTFSFDEVFIR